MTIANNAPVSTNQSTAAPVSPAVRSELPCVLRWRQDKLWVSSVVRGKDYPLPALGRQEWFRACLSKSKAELVCIDPALGTEVISLWAAACQETEKPLYLRIPASPYMPAKQKPVAWLVKRVCDRLGALLLLLLLSPLLLAIAGLIKLQGDGPIIARQWRVGERGRLFQVLNFRTVVTHGGPLPQAGINAPATPPTLTRLGHLLKRTHLNKLPLLVNVLRGELSLVGPHPWAIYETLTLPTELQTRMHILPGITGTLQNFAHFPLAHPRLVQRITLQDLHELGQWSLLKDFRQLTATTLQMLTITD